MDRNAVAAGHGSSTMTMASTLSLLETLKGCLDNLREQVETAKRLSQAGSSQRKRSPGVKGTSEHSANPAGSPNQTERLTRSLEAVEAELREHNKIVGTLVPALASMLQSAGAAGAGADGKSGRPTQQQQLLVQTVLSNVLHSNALQPPCQEPILSMAHQSTTRRDNSISSDHTTIVYEDSDPSRIDPQSYTAFLRPSTSNPDLQTYTHESSIQSRQIPPRHDHIANSAAPNITVLQKTEQGNSITSRTDPDTSLPYHTTDQDVSSPLTHPACGPSPLTHPACGPSLADKPWPTFSPDKPWPSFISKASGAQQTLPSISTQHALSLSASSSSSSTPSRTTSSTSNSNDQSNKSHSTTPKADPTDYYYPTWALGPNSQMDTVADSSSSSTPMSQPAAGTIYARSKNPFGDSPVRNSNPFNDLLGIEGSQQPCRLHGTEYPQATDYSHQNGAQQQEIQSGYSCNSDYSPKADAFNNGANTRETDHHTRDRYLEPVMGSNPMPQSPQSPQRRLYDTASTPYQVGIDSDNQQSTRYKSSFSNGGQQQSSNPHITTTAWNPAAVSATASADPSSSNHLTTASHLPPPHISTLPSPAKKISPQTSPVQSPRTIGYATQPASEARSFLLRLSRTNSPDTATLLSHTLPFPLPHAHSNSHSPPLNLSTHTLHLQPNTHSLHPLSRTATSDSTLSNFHHHLTDALSSHVQREPSQLQVEAHNFHLDPSYANPQASPPSDDQFSSTVRSLNLDQISLTRQMGRSLSIKTRRHLRCFSSPELTLDSDHDIAVQEFWNRVCPQQHGTVAPQLRDLFEVRQVAVRFDSCNDDSIEGEEDDEEQLERNNSLDSNVSDNSERAEQSGFGRVARAGTFYRSKGDRSAEQEDGDGYIQDANGIMDGVDEVGGNGDAGSSATHVCARPVRTSKWSTGEGANKHFTSNKTADSSKDKRSDPVAPGDRSGPAPGHVMFQANAQQFMFEREPSSSDSDASFDESALLDADIMQLDTDHNWSYSKFDGAREREAVQEAVTNSGSRPEVAVAGKDDPGQQHSYWQQMISGWAQQTGKGESAGRSANGKGGSDKGADGKGGNGKGADGRGADGKGDSSRRGDGQGDNDKGAGRYSESGRGADGTGGTGRGVESKGGYDCRDGANQGGPDDTSTGNSRAQSAASGPGRNQTNEVVPGTGTGSYENSYSAEGKQGDSHHHHHRNYRNSTESLRSTSSTVDVDDMTDEDATSDGTYEHDSDSGSRGSKERGGVVGSWKTRGRRRARDLERCRSSCELLMVDVPLLLRPVTKFGGEYRLLVVTADKLAAGIGGSQATVEILGLQGVISQQLPRTRGAFQRGSQDCFRISSDNDVGDIVAVKVWHDASGIGSLSWCLERVELESVLRGTKYIFPNPDKDGWISKGQGNAVMLKPQMQKLGDTEALQTEKVELESQLAHNQQLTVEEKSLIMNRLKKLQAKIEGQ